jgi:serine/threonine protein kinase
MPPECLPFLKLKAQEIRNVNFEKLEVFGIAMIALEAMLFNSTRKYYSNCSSNEYSLTFDERLMRKDFRELKEIYPQNLTNLLEKMVRIDPKERITLFEAKEYIKSIRE